MITLEQIIKFIEAYGNASCDCGKFNQPEDDITNLAAYHKLLEKDREVKRDLIDAIRKHKMQ